MGVNMWVFFRMFHCYNLLSKNMTFLESIPKKS